MHKRFNFLSTQTGGYIMYAATLPLALIISLIIFGLDNPSFPQEPETKDKLSQIVGDWQQHKADRVGILSPSGAQAGIPVDLIGELIFYRLSEDNPSLAQPVETKSFLSQVVNDWQRHSADHNVSVASILESTSRAAANRSRSRADGPPSNASSGGGSGGGSPNRSDGSQQSASSGGSGGSGSGGNGGQSSSASGGSSGDNDSGSNSGGENGRSNSGGKSNGSNGGSSQPSVVSGDFVTTDGTDFELDGDVFRFAGTNAYYLPTYEKINPDFVTDTLDVFADTGIEVVRMWGFYDGPPQYDDDITLQPEPGVYNETDLRHLDSVIAKGKERGIRFVITLVNNWGELGGVPQYNEWDGAGSAGLEHFINDPDTQAWFKDYIFMLLNRTNTETGTRYKNEPVIFGWEIINEARIRDGDPEELRDWYQDIAQHIKSIDGNHLVATGEDGFDEDTPDAYSLESYSNQYALRANEGSSYILNTNIPEIDYGGAHWYPSVFGFGTDADTGLLLAQQTWIDDHVAIAQAAGKPFVLGEYGFPGWGDGRVSTVYDALWDQAEANDLDGSLFWQLTTNHFKCYEYGGNICYPDGRADTALYNDFRAHVTSMSGNSSVDANQSAEADPDPEPESDDGGNDSGGSSDGDASAETFSATLRIMPLGDSISGDWKPRSVLDGNLTDAGYDFDLVGSLSTDWASGWDVDHEGHAGYSSVTIEENISGWLEDNPADIILFMIGTNDFAWWSNRDAEDVADQFETDLDIIRAEAPEAKIIISTIPLQSSKIIDSIGEDRAELAAAYNDEVRSRVAQRIAAGQDLTLVDLEAEMNSSDLISDGIHLTSSGYEKLGDLWFEAISGIYTPE